jgi:hypothetical protein
MSDSLNCYIGGSASLRVGGLCVSQPFCAESHRTCPPKLPNEPIARRAGSLFHVKRLEGMKLRNEPNPQSDSLSVLIRVPSVATDYLCKITKRTHYGEGADVGAFGLRALRSKPRKWLIFPVRFAPTRPKLPET